MGLGAGAGVGLGLGVGLGDGAGVTHCDVSVVVNVALPVFAPAIGVGDPTDWQFMKLLNSS